MGLTMSIRDLLENTDGRNLAEDFDEDELRKIGEDVVKRYARDLSSMSDWMALIDKGMDMIEQDMRPKSLPFDGASNYKSPILREAAIKFGDRATLELLNARNLVKGDVIGKDPENKKAQQIDRVCEFMNYQLNHEMVNWRENQEGLFYRLPYVGNMFKKTYYDPFQQRNESCVIYYPDFVVNQATDNIDTAKSFTHILAFDRNAVFERQEAGLWIDVDIYSDDEENPNSETGSNEENDVNFADDNEDKFLEQHCFADLDDDGYAEPYIVTVRESNAQVVRIVARYTENTIRVKHDGRIKTLDAAIKRQAKEFNETVAAGAQTALIEAFEVDFTGMKMVAVEASSQITSYSFYPSAGGTFLGEGYFHMIANLFMAINAATNQLMDAGQLATLGGGFLAKGFRKKMGIVRLAPGKYMATEVDPQHLRNGILPNPSPEPSQTLYALNDKMEMQLRNFTLAANNEESGIMANTAPTTALAMISEQAIPTSALLLRITEAEGKEFRRLFALNQIHGDAEDYQMILDDEEANFERDFNSKNMDIVPVANPELSSRMIRAQMAEAQMAIFDRVLQAGGNPVPLLEDYLEMIGSTIQDRVFPEDGSMSPAEKQQMEAMRAAQEQANQLQTINIELLRQQVDNGKIEAESLAVKRQFEIQNLIVETKETIANTKKIMAEAALKGEEAETESLANQITTYTASMQALTDSMERIAPKESRATRPYEISNMSNEELIRIVQGG